MNNALFIIIICLSISGIFNALSVGQLKNRISALEENQVEIIKELKTQ